MTNSEYYQRFVLNNLSYNVRYLSADRVAPESLEILASFPHTSIKDNAKGGIMEKLTQEKLKELLSYDPQTGIFRYRYKLRSKNRISGRSNKITGCKNRGRITICINYKNYFAHRLAWLYHHGYLPENGIDHINRNPSDNRIKNLREVSQSCNMRNCGNPKDNKSGVKGVCFDSNENKWCAYITSNKKHKKIGRYNNKDEAVLARLAAEQCLNWQDCDNSSPAKKYALENKLIRSQ